MLFSIKAKEESKSFTIISDGKIYLESKFTPHFWKKEYRSYTVNTPSGLELKADIQHASVSFGDSFTLSIRSSKDSRISHTIRVHSFPFSLTAYKGSESLFSLDSSFLKRKTFSKTFLKLIKQHY